MSAAKFGQINSDIQELLEQSNPQDAIQMLMEDHRRVEEIGKSYESLGDDEKVQAAHMVLVELALHAAVEEKLIYPLLEEIGEEDGNYESLEEHHVMKYLMSELESMDSVDDRMNAKFKVLLEIVQHHVQEEETEYFPKLKAQKEAELKSLTTDMVKLKTELLGMLEEQDKLSAIDPELAPKQQAGRGSRGNVVSIDEGKKNRSRSSAGKKSTTSSKRRPAAAASKSKTGKAKNKTTGRAKAASARSTKGKNGKSASTRASKSGGSKGSKRAASTTRGAKQASGTKKKASSGKSTTSKTTRRKSK